MTNVVIVTGASGALGRAVVMRLKADGFAVAAVDAAPVMEIDADLVLPKVDLADAAAVGAAFEAVASTLGSVNGLANIAGGFVWEPIVGGEAGTWDRMFRTNLLTAALASRAALPSLLKQGGAIVNVGAAGAIDPATGMAPYAASKAGVMAMTRSLAAELRGTGVRVNAILPTILDTPTNRQDMPDANPAEWIKPADAAEVIAFLLSDAAVAINGSGITLAVS
ncbi:MULTISPECIES: SDR family NAD(P)-dependent oxidoreductase [unclassified Caulobacter]|jgi:NAD(P)-dependent dehydrogenase (short-subunit alcohol dehydrogenase family)|uniref:SDR family NAD(P)-dependent oxidoreductase n=1 Tax=unclassified Caulobacter TaxID=2648921 RepID=UPI0003C15E24|nr:MULTISPECIES: SDR family NAD(P)-dependent oxidoreductase [unclassified Caulobacter]AZS19289.1 SDR family NAD(P)-dependent oxidoreductase [Caulobacter sp. FWC26]PIB90056.1 NAD-dependent oxidoreductase [Caulobacter sp. FWC2]